MASRSATTNKNANSVVHVKVKKVILIIVCQHRNERDNNTFKAVQANLAREYTTMFGNKYKIVNIYASTGKSLADIINSYDENRIRSMDILSHSNHNAMFMSESGDLWGGDGLYISNWQQIWAIGIDGADIGEINFKNFTNNARIEIHGCNGASEDYPNDNIVHKISILLFNAGKKKSYAIGHTTKNNPNIKGKHTRIKEQYYRHTE